MDPVEETDAPPPLVAPVPLLPEPEPVPEPAEEAEIEPLLVPFVPALDPEQPGANARIALPRIALSSERMTFEVSFSRKYFSQPSGKAAEKAAMVPTKFSKSNLFRPVLRDRSVPQSKVDVDTGRSYAKGSI